MEKNKPWRFEAEYINILNFNMAPTVFVAVTFVCELL